MTPLFVGLSLSTLAWIYLTVFHGRFWRADQVLPKTANGRKDWPKVAACIPARNEEETIGDVVRSHLAMDYPGEYRVVLVDDKSTDATAVRAREAMGTGGDSVAAQIFEAPDICAGWTGKMWALNHAVTQASRIHPDAKYYLLTDADIVYAPETLSRLVAHAEGNRFALTSVMATLDSRGFWAGVFIPAFVYFFQKLYPFPRVNDGGDSMAAAAGGCVLVNADALRSEGGIDKIRGELIDDCALARLIKGEPPRRRIWLGFDEGVTSLRDNRSLASIWNMVARTAYTQLNYSVFLLFGTVLGMLMIYVLPPVAVMTYFIHLDRMLLMLGLLGWSLMVLTFRPTLRRYGKRAVLGVMLPAAAFAYTLMTVHSAVRHWMGQGGRWKGRTYPMRG